MPPPLPPTPHGALNQQAPEGWVSAPHRHGTDGSWLRLMSVIAIAVFLLLSIGLLLTQRDALLDRAKAQAQREVSRLTLELEQTLRLAKASIDVVLHSPEVTSEQLLGDHHTLIESLTLPFALKAADPASADLPASQWLPGISRNVDGSWFIPLTWQQPTEQGGRAFEVLLLQEALLKRFAVEGAQSAVSLGLFKVEDSGAMTVLVRYPFAESDQGKPAPDYLVQAVAQGPSGTFETPSSLDRVHRLVSYQRLEGTGHRLVVGYGLRLSNELAAWQRQLPWAMALILAVTAAMAYGALRLDRAIQQRHRSERHFQTLSDHLPDMVVRCDREGRVLYVNPAVERASGIAPEAMLGRTMEQFGTPPEIARRWIDCLKRVFDTGMPDTLYFTHPGPSGERHWEAQVSREPVLAGEKPTALVINRDITERHEAEARRLSAQQLFESVFQAAPEAMSLADWDSGRLLLVNDAFCRLFGRSREQVIGATSTELGLWRQADDRQRLLAALEKGDKVRDAQGQSLRPDGQEIHVRYSAERVTVDGQARLLLMFRDVTQLEMDQRALARSELRFRLAAAHGQVWEWDFGRSFMLPNDEFFLALGHPSPPNEQMGQRFLDLIHPEDLPRLHHSLRRFFKGEADYRLEFRARDAQGGYRWFDTRGSGLRDASGHVTYMAGTMFDISDRKALEEAQRQTLVQLETVANASPALFWSCDTDSRWDWFNQSWLDFTGRSLEQEVGAGWQEGVHPDDLAAGASVYQKAFEARAPFQMEYRLRRHDGQYRWMLVHGKPRADADQRFIGYIGSCIDLTELKQAEANARESGAMLEQVFDVLQDMLFVVDERERFVHYHAGGKDMLYTPPEQFLGRAFADVMPPEQTTQLREAMARARSQGLQDLEYSLALPDGTHTFNTRLAWLPSSGHCMFLVRDVTERQAAQLERERLNRFVFLLFGLANRFINLPVQQADAAINEALGDMGRFVDADRAYLFDYDMAAETASNTHEWCGDGVSPAIEDLQNIPFAMIPDWFEEHSHGRVMHVPDVQALPESNLRAFLEPQGIQSLMALPLMHGERCLGFVGLDSVRRTHNYGEEETTLLLLFAQMLVNIRLRVEAEEQIRGLTEGLERKVVERTAQLGTSVQQLQAVNRELESFTYSASHDLRTPLRGIEGFSSLLLDEHAEQLDDQGREYLRRIQRATLHMSRLVNDLLAYSRLQQLTDLIEPVDLASAVQEVAAPFRDEIEAREGRLQVVISDGLAVRANPQGLAIVLRNLIDNALKFTPAGEAPRIRIEARGLGDRVLLSVSDQGIGFDMKYHDRIFGMFQRLHRQEQIPGTGIGLALVQKAVERMGGQIRAQSAPGQGARFEIDLPSA